MEVSSSKFHELITFALSECMGANPFDGEHRLAIMDEAGEELLISIPLGPAVSSIKCIADCLLHSHSTGTIKLAEDCKIALENVSFQLSEIVDYDVFEPPSDQDDET